MRKLIPRPHYNKFYKLSLYKMNSSTNTYFNQEKSNQDIILTPKEGYDRVLVFMHGLGDSAMGYRDLFLSEQRPIPGRIKVILLTAPQQPVTMNGGMVMNSWYDIKCLGKSENNVDETQVNKSAYRIKKVIENEANKLNGDYSKIILGGFSQGACITLHVGLGTLEQNLGGLVTLSGYLFPFTELLNSQGKTSIPILLAHGAYDELIPEPHAKESYKRLFDGGYDKVTYKSYDEGHSITYDELVDIKSFINNLI